MSNQNLTTRKPRLVSIGDALVNIVGSAIVAGAAVGVLFMALGAFVADPVAKTTRDLAAINQSLGETVAKLEEATR